VLLSLSVDLVFGWLVVMDIKMYQFPIVT